MQNFLEKHAFDGQVRGGKEGRDAVVEACIRARVVPIPMLSKLKDGELALDNFRLNPGLASALGSTVLSGATGLRKLLLRNNGTVDADLGKVLEGLLEAREPPRSL